MLEFDSSQRGISRRWFKRLGRWLATFGFVVFTNAAMANASGFYHTVQPGETLDTIAQRYRVPVYQIARANRLSVNIDPSPGAKIWVPGARQAGTPKPPTKVSVPKPAPQPVRTSLTPGDGVYSVQKGDSLWKIAQNHQTSVDAIKALNGLRGNSLQIGQQLRIPSGQTDSVAPSRNSVPSPSKPSSASASQSMSSPIVQGGMGAGQKRASREVSSQGYSWPLDGPIIRPFVQTSQEKHFGINIGAPVGSEVLAAKSGIVAFSGESISAYGKMVVIEHSNNIATCYAYNDKLLVSQGQQVQQGEPIALSGDGWHDSRPHLHFQVRRNGNAVDPLPYLP